MRRIYWDCIYNFLHVLEANGITINTGALINEEDLLEFSLTIFLMSWKQMEFCLPFQMSCRCSLVKSDLLGLCLQFSVCLGSMLRILLEVLINLYQPKNLSVSQF